MGVGNMIGPLTLTVGQPFRLDLAPDTAYVDIQNDSLNDVWVHYGETQPTDITNANKTWHRVVRRQHNGLLPTVGYRGASAAERQTNTIGAFKGRIWLLAVSPGGLAVTGTISGRSQVYVTPYAIGDALPSHSSLSTQMDLSSQPRVIAIPPTHSTPPITEIMDFTASGQYITPVQGTAFPPLGQATWSGSQILVCYVYYLTAILSGHTGTPPKWAQVYLFFTELNLAAAVTSRTIFQVFEIWQNEVNGTAQNYIFTPHFPLNIQFAPANTTAIVEVQALLNNADPTNTANTRVYLNAGIDYDVNNHQPVGAIGGGQFQVFTQAGNAPLF